MRYDKHVVGENLKRERTSHQWSQNWVSRQTGICVRTLSRAENGQGMSASKLKVLANFYGVQLANLYCERKPTSFADIITPIPFYKMAGILEDSEFLGIVQKMVILYFKDLIQEEALLSRVDAKKLADELLGLNKQITEKDFVNIILTINRRTLEKIEQLVYRVPEK